MSLDTYRLYQNVVAAGTLYTPAMTTEVCETLGRATVPREVTPGLRPVMEIAAVPEDLINWSASRRQRIEDPLEVLTDQYVKDHRHPPGECGRHGLGWWTAQETRPAKKKPKPLAQLLAWWRASAILRFGQQLIETLLDRCRAEGAAIRARVDPTVDVTLAAVDVAAVVFTVREKFSRRHILAEARRHLLETLRGREFSRGLGDYIARRALLRYSRRHTVTQPGREAPAADRMTYTPTFRCRTGGGSPPPKARRHGSPAAASGPVSPALPCRTRSATPASEPTPLPPTRRRPRPSPRPPITATSRARRRPLPTPSTTPAGPPP
ncbi:relaxase domain-containing protein [Streptomyces lavenduligriseus]|nr:relaxase domain-containing protein [Streptomyces lavenduligriseus]